MLIIPLLRVLMSDQKSIAVTNKKLPLQLITSFSQLIYNRYQNFYYII